MAALSSSTHFLVVDDYENIRNLLKSQLASFGFSENVSEADSVESAIEFLGSKKVDFIISDWNMGAMTGLDFLNWARANDHFKDTPFLILTTENEQAKILSAIKAGVSNFLLKPWEEEDLSEKISLCWKKHHG